MRHLSEAHMKARSDRAPREHLHRVTQPDMGRDWGLRCYIQSRILGRLRSGPKTWMGPAARHGHRGILGLKWMVLVSLEVRRDDIGSAVRPFRREMTPDVNPFLVGQALKESEDSTAV
ncbi:hypothetical protein HFD88_004424 [Aspergillus terreus]|nr:hypothetical protein HFD88_004424 [Aspergillus terreus]